MALPHLVRTTEVARLLGIHPDTCIRWCRRLGVQLVQCPPRGMPTSREPGTPAGRNAPAYLGIDAAVRLVDLCLPGVVAKRERARARASLERRADRQQQGARNVVHERCDME
jgi:hypothetical protein